MYAHLHVTCSWLILHIAIAIHSRRLRQTSAVSKTARDQQIFTYLRTMNYAQNVRLKRDTKM